MIIDVKLKNKSSKIQDMPIGRLCICVRDKYSIRNEPAIRTGNEIAFPQSETWASIATCEDCLYEFRELFEGETVTFRK